MSLPSTNAITSSEYAELKILSIKLKLYSLRLLREVLLPPGCVDAGKRLLGCYLQGISWVHAGRNSIDQVVQRSCR